MYGYTFITYISSVQLLSHVWLFETPWTVACQAFLSITNTQSLLKLMSIKSIMPSNHLIFCHPLHLLPSMFPSIRVFSNESILRIRWPKYWSFNFRISPCNEYSGQISFRIDWFDLLAVQGTLKSLLQHHSSKASILWCSAFFIVQLSHPYMRASCDFYIYLTNSILEITFCNLLFPFSYVTKVYSEYLQIESIFSSLCVLFHPTTLPQFFKPSPLKVNILNTHARACAHTHNP